MFPLVAEHGPQRGLSSRAGEGHSRFADATSRRTLVVCQMERAQIGTVLFDLGGVLTPDPWQTLVLTPGRGLADRLGIDRGRAAAAAQRLWNRYVVQAHADEREYWRELGDAIGMSIPDRLVSALDSELLRPNREADALLASLAERHVRVGVVSDNTTFWYEKQARLIGLDRFVDSSLLFLSFRLGVTKGDVPGLFEIAAASVDPDVALVVDDREECVRRARMLGFEARHYSLEWNRSLAEAIER